MQTIRQACVPRAATFDPARRDAALDLMKISTILSQIDLGSIALPEFQRGFVWNREQVHGLFHDTGRVTS